MAIADFTSPDDIRAALGVSIVELPDAVVSLPLYENSLAMDLDELSADLVGAYTAAVAKPVDSRSTAESKLLRVVQLFTTYSVARHLGTTMPMFGPKQIGDGRATMVRFSQDPFSKTLDRVEALYLKYRQATLDAVSVVLGTGSQITGMRPFLAVVTPSSDPVTGT